MRILHVIPAFYPATYWGGPVTSVYGLCNSLAALEGVELTVLSTDTAGPARHQRVSVDAFPMRYQPGYDVFFCHRWFGADIAPVLLWQLFKLIRASELVHLTGVYSFPTIPTLLFCRLLGKRVVWSPRGALQRWKLASKPWGKFVWEKVCNALIKRGMCVLHVTSPEEAADSRARILKAETQVIPNGVDIPQVLQIREWMPDGKLRLLYLGRIHPIKGIENILYALKLLDHIDLSLAIYGRGEEQYLSNLQGLARELAIEHRVYWGGHVEHDEKARIFSSADVCIVPSFSENFGMVVAEALAHGVPVVASKGTPWQQIEDKQCGFWVDNNPESLGEAIFRIRSCKLYDMGRKGRAWMQSEFGWGAIAQDMYSCYRNLQQRDLRAGNEQ